jgi:outer membrane protein assembly factor BamE (lipoprotein component of BamABCDE complex)
MKSFLIVSLAFALLACVAVGYWSFTGCSVDSQQFRKIRSGMKMSEVQSLIGKPSTKRSEGVTEIWIYHRPLMLCRGFVSFNLDDRVFSTFHDH